MTDRRRLALLALLILAASATYLVGNGTTALWDRDEPRYAQTSRQMLQSGDWVVPHFLDLVRTAKPPMIYWCQAAAMALFGDQGEAGTFASPAAVGGGHRRAAGRPVGRAVAAAGVAADAVDGDHLRHERG